MIGNGEFFNIGSEIARELYNNLLAWFDKNVLVSFSGTYLETFRKAICYGPKTLIILLEDYVSSTEMKRDSSYQDLELQKIN